MTVTVLDHTTVLPCTGADPFEGAVVIEDQRIADVVDKRPNINGAEVIDCGGRTVMPGMIDAHVHVSSVDVEIERQRRNHPTSLLAYEIAAEIRRTLDQGYTTVRDAGGADWGMKEAVARGLVTGPSMLVSGHPLSQTGGHGDGRSRAEDDSPCGCGAHIGMVPNIADGPDEVRKAVREQLRRGADQIKVMAGGGVASPTDSLESVQYSLDELQAAVAAAAEANTYVLAHAYTPRAIRNAVQAGVRSVEHGNFLDDQTAALMAEQGTYLVPTFAAYEKLYEQGREQGFAAEKLSKLDRVLGEGLDSLQRAVDAGVQIGSGSDLLGPLARWKPRELAIKAKVLGNHQALMATTRTNAELLGINADVGTIEAGKRADLLVTEQDPLADIDVLQNSSNLAVILQSGSFHKNQL